MQECAVTTMKSRNGCCLGHSSHVLSRISGLCKDIKVFDNISFPCQILFKNQAKGLIRTESLMENHEQLKRSPDFGHTHSYKYGVVKTVQLIEEEEGATQYLRLCQGCSG